MSARNVSRVLPVLACIVCGALGFAQESPSAVETFDSLAAWQVDWTGHAVGSVEAKDGAAVIAARFDPTENRQGHPRLTMTRTFDAPQDLSRFTGLRLRVHVQKPLDAALWLHLIEAGGVRYRCDTVVKMGLVGEWQDLITRFDTDFAWDFESSPDPNQKLDLDAIVGLRLMMQIPEDADGCIEIDDISAYTEPPPPTANLIWIKNEGGAIRLLPPATPLPAQVSLDVTIGKLEPTLQKPELTWEARDAWGRALGTGRFTVVRNGENSAPMTLGFADPSYAAVDLRLMDGEQELRKQTFCLAVLPEPAPEDAAPREDSIFGIWPGGYGTWIKLGAKWARTYCQPWDFEPQPDGSYKYVRTDKDGKPLPFPPDLEGPLNYICFFRGMPKWLSTRPDRADYRKFPPTDWNEYARFVTWYVNQMKDRVHVWETWNEPVPYAYWMGTMEEVVKLHEVTYKAVHDADPEAIVLGPCPYNIRLPFTEEFFEMGGGQWIDAVVVHAYMDQPDPNFLEDLQWLRWTLDDHGLQKDIWVTEVGWDTRRYTELQQASYLVQTYAIGLAEGVHTIIWHMNWDFNDPALRGGHGLLRYNHQPKPALAAYAMMIRTLEGATYEMTLSGHDRPQPDDPAVVYQFRKNGKRIWVVWGRKPCVWLPPCPKWEVRDMMGARKPPDNPNDPPGLGSYNLNESPIYGFELE